MTPSRMLIVSNRLPIVIEKNKEGELSLESGSGGLVTALAPILRHRGGLWVGWPGTLDHHDDKAAELLLNEGAKTVGFQLTPVFLSKEEVDRSYHGFSNEIIWPLFHDRQFECHFNPDYWHGYQEVNQKFADDIGADGYAEDAGFAVSLAKSLMAD